MISTNVGKYPGFAVKYMYDTAPKIPVRTAVIPATIPRFLRISEALSLFCVRNPSQIVKPKTPTIPTPNKIQTMISVILSILCDYLQNGEQILIH